MKKAMMLFVLTVFCMASVPVYAGDNGAKGASTQGREHASENAIFNRVGDWFATVGKSDEEKAAIKAERKAKRAAKKAEKQGKKKAKEAKEKMKGKKKDLDKKMKKGS